MNLWWSAVHCQNPVPGLPVIRCVGRALKHDPRYHLNNQMRKNDNFAVFQYTLRGCGLFSNTRCSLEVPAGTGFLCMANDSGVRYQYPPQAREAWEFVFITWFGLEETVRHLCNNSPLFTLPLNHPVISELLTWERYRSSSVGLNASATARPIHHLLTSLSEQLSLKPVVNNSLVDNFLHIIESPKNLRLQIEDIATRLNISREHLSRVLKQETGSSANEHVQRRRIQAACDLLIANNLTIKEIATQSGFHDGSHFARQFRAIMGMSPRAYQQAGILGNDWTMPL